jgi:predicted TIM-barrel fold metal-dependent hydrolase
MNIIQTSLTIISFILMAVIPFALFGYLGTKLRKHMLSRYLVKHPEKTEKELKVRVMMVTLGMVTLSLVLLMILVYIVVYFVHGASPQDNKVVDSPVSLSLKIDTHEHFRSGGDINNYLAAMKIAHIDKMVLIPTDWPASNNKYKEHMAAALKASKDHPGKFIVYATSWNKDPEAARIIEEALKQGARGIKFIDWLYSAKYSATEAGPVNSSNMYQVYKVAEKYKVPVLLHIDFQNKPEWRDQFWQVAKDFPNVTFILAHYCRSASGKVPNLKLCADTLDKFPNVYTDIAMGGGVSRYAKYFDQDVRPFQQFITKYQDRILWGADLIIDGRKSSSGQNKDGAWIAKRMLTNFFILELLQWKSVSNPTDEHFHRGLGLSKEVLNKIYWQNPKRILKL